MAWSLLKHTKAGSTTSANATTPAIDTTGADLIVVCGAFYGLVSSIGTLTDSPGNTYTILTSVRDGSNCGSVIAYIYAPTTNASHTFTITTAGNYPAICVMAFSGSVSSPFDVQGGAHSSNSSVTSIQTGNITPTQNGDLIVTGLCGASAGTNTPSLDLSFTVSDVQVGITSGCFQSSAGYLVQGTATTVNPTWSWGTSQAVATTFAAFKGTAVAAAAETVQSVIVMM
jgi:hypothetical protein